MARRLMWCGVFSFLLACGQGTDPAQNNQTVDMVDQRQDDMGATPDMAPTIQGKPLKVATFNTRLLFDTKCNSGNCGPDQFEQLPTEAELDARILQVREAIRILDPDILVFQEIETKVLFDRVLGDYASRYPTQVFAETGFSASLDVAVIAKGQFLSLTSHKDTRLTTSTGQSTTFARDLPEVHVDFDGQRVIIFGAHFVSKRSDDGPRRVAEAKEAARLMSARANDYPDAYIFLAGDLNDTPDSDALGQFFAQGIGSVAAGQPSDYYTHGYLGDYIVIDHVLFVRRDSLTLDKSAVRAFHDDREIGFLGSDHAAVRATFYYKP